MERAILVLKKAEKKLEDDLNYYDKLMSDSQDTHFKKQTRKHYRKDCRR